MIAEMLLVLIRRMYFSLMDNLIYILGAVWMVFAVLWAVGMISFKADPRVIEGAHQENDGYVTLPFFPDDQEHAYSFNIYLKADEHDKEDDCASLLKPIADRFNSATTTKFPMEYRYIDDIGCLMQLRIR